MSICKKSVLDSKIYIRCQGLKAAQKQYGGGCGIYIKSQRKPQNRISDFHKIINKYLLHISELYIAGKQMINSHMKTKVGGNLPNNNKKFSFFLFFLAEILQ